MGGLFGGGPSGGNANNANDVAGSALADEPRRMPDPESPRYRRAQVKRRARRMRRSGRASTNLTGDRIYSPSALGQL